jgi:hypothetical protein
VLEPSRRDDVVVTASRLWVWFFLSTKSHHDMSLWELALSATRFDLLVKARGALEEPASLDARASERWLIVCGGVSCGLSVIQGRT